MAAGFVIQFLLALAFKQVNALVKLEYAVAELRMVIFAATLITVMLLRPQGILAHHEFSWNWFLPHLRSCLSRLRLIGSAGLSDSLRRMTLPASCIAIVGFGAAGYGLLPTTHTLDDLVDARREQIGYETYAGLPLENESLADVPVMVFVYTMPDRTKTVEFLEIVTPKDVTDETELSDMTFKRLTRPSEELKDGFLSTISGGEDASVLAGPEYRIPQIIVLLAALLAALAVIALLLRWAQDLEPTGHKEAA